MHSPQPFPFAFINALSLRPVGWLLALCLLNATAVASVEPLPRGNASEPVASAPPVDSDGDGIPDALDPCPFGPNPGTTCDDGNPFTTGDVIQLDCSCGGNAPAATDWTMEFSTDNQGNETIWQLVDANSSFVVANGGPYGNQVTRTESFAVPNAASLRLVVSDAGGNGMSMGIAGGWVLRDAAGRRVIDNSYDAVFGALSEPDLPFNTTVSNMGLIQAQCDRLNWSGGLMIATPDPAVSAQYGIGNQADDGYEFWFFDPDGGYDRHVFLSHANPGIGGPTGPTKCCHLGYTNLQTNPVPANVLLNVRIRSAVNGVYGAWGPACRFKIDPLAAQCPLTQLMSAPGNTFSCGATNKVVGATNYTGRLFAQPTSRSVNGTNQPANAYFFELIQPYLGYQRNVVSSSYSLQLGSWASNPLLSGTWTYNVRVKVSFDGGLTWCPFGNACSVGITNNLPAPYSTPVGPMAGGNDHIFVDGDAPMGMTDTELRLWPNPNSGDQLHLTLEGLEAEEGTATIELFDMVGHRVAMHTLPLNGSSVNTVIALDASLAKGLYLVTATTGTEQFNARLVIQ
ncbi:MAG: T9SS type A sorting domain-containing protein [Flavobacteriales bacterium]|nr:T9SS type A sorting domain-containing protein [Flavobacteriales bacterium]